MHPGRGGPATSGIGPAVLAALLIASAAGAQTGVLEGAVLEAETGVPVAGASVLLEADPPRGRAADARGRFRIEDVPIGRVAVRVRAVGYVRLDTTVVVVEGETAVLEVALRPAVLEAAEVVVQARRSQTATRADAPVLLVPQSVAVVGPGVLDGQNALDAQDALRNVPGASVQVQGQPGGVPVLRGFAADQTGGGVRRNGVEVPYLFDGLQANVERVEVLRGPASVLYGRLEPGGVVNFITEKPRAERHLEAEVGAGTLGSGRLVLDAGAPVGAVATRLNASLDQTGFARDDVTMTTAFAAPAARWRPSPALTLDLEGEAVAAQTTIDPGLAGLGRDLADLGGVPRERFFGEPDAVHDWRSAGLFANADWAASRTAGVRGGASLARYRLRRDFLDLDGLRGGDVARGLQRETLAFTYLKGTAFADFGAETGPVRHAVTVGVEAIRAWAQADGVAPLTSGPRGLEFATIDPVDLEDPRATGLPTDQVDYLDASVGGLDAGAFVQDRATVRFGPSALHVVGAVRVSHVRFDATIRALADTPEAPAGISERGATATAVTPSAGVVLEAVPGLAFYVSSGTSFNPIVERVDRTGEPFRPTRGVQVEGGVKADGPRASAALSAFWIRKDDALTVGPGGFFDQTGRQRSRGVEAEVRASPLPGVTALAAYALLDAVVLEDDNVAPGTPLPFAPRHAASVWAELVLGRLAVRGGAWAQSGRTGSLGSSLELPSEVVVDLGLALEVGRGVTVRLDGRNVLDERGYTAARTRPGDGGVPLLVAWPNRGREVRLGVVVR